MNSVDPTLQPSRHTPLLLLALVFIAPMLVAGALVLAGWQPDVKAEGQPITPQRNLVDEGVQITLEDGTTWAWRDAKPRLTLLALPGPDCASACMQALTHLAEARLMLNQNQPRLRLLYVGPAPAAADASGMRNYWSIGQGGQDSLAAWRPTQPDSVAAVLVESNGTALSLYPAGTDAASVLRDLRKVIR